MCKYLHPLNRGFLGCIYLVLPCFVLNLGGGVVRFCEQTPTKDLYIYRESKGRVSPPLSRFMRQGGISKISSPNHLTLHASSPHTPTFHFNFNSAGLGITAAAFVTPCA